MHKIRHCSQEPGAEPKADKLEGRMGCTSNTGDLFHSVVNDVVKGKMEYICL